MPVLRSLKTVILLIAAFACGSALAFFAWQFEGRPQDIAAAPAGGLVDGKFACLSYAPYRDGQTPFNESFVVPPSQIDEDLTILAAHTACVRTYSTSQGLAEVVPLAARHGLKVLLGAWIGSEGPKNDREIAATIKLANAYPNTVAAVIVGNEVLLRRDQTAQKLDSYLKQVKAAVHMPVTYADVWEFWLQNPQLASDVDFITVHMLPYWEDQPIAVPRALQHVTDILKKVQASFPGRKLFVGEIGWPSLGRMREDARPSPTDQARFLREFVALSQNLGVGYNFIEAFDQSWKRASEGTVGGHWGLYDSRRQAKVELAGPVSDDPFWRRNWLIGCGLGVVVLITGLVRRGAPSSDGRWMFAAGLLASLAGPLLQAHIVYVRDTALTRFDWLTGAAALALSILAVVFAVITLIERASGTESPARVPMTDILDAIAHARIERSRAFLAGLTEALVLMFGTATALAILVDGRYRDFPSVIYLTPAISFIAYRIAGNRGAIAVDRPAYLLALGLAAIAVGIVINESLHNSQAVLWAATLLLLAMPWVLEAARSAYGLSRATTASPNTRPTDAGPAL